MSIFKLPDLGEGLPDATIQAWFVKEGDTVTVDQPLVAMETAKAVVEVPSPQSGTIERLHGEAGDVLKTGSPLVSFIAQNTDKGTVVGHLEESDVVLETNSVVMDHVSRPLATPAVRLLAKQHGIPLAAIVGTGEMGLITRADVEGAVSLKKVIPEGFERLAGVRKQMVSVMTHSHQSVVPIQLFDEVDVSAWSKDEDITVRLIQAIVAGCKAVPEVNVWFDDTLMARRLFDAVHLGLAMETPDGLFVPVIHNAQDRDKASLREAINTYKVSVSNRTVEPSSLVGATITLSNIGLFAGRFATPIIVPPAVAIIAAGRIYDTAARRMLPLSLSVDHRVVTGAEAARFLKAMMDALIQ